jgi:hypothetical protein
MAFGVSGFIAGAVEDAFQKMLARDLLEQQRIEQRQQQAFENEMRRRQLASTEAQTASTETARKEASERQKRLDAIENARVTLAMAERGFDPRSGTPLDVTAETAEALAGTPYATALETRMTLGGMRPVTPELAGTVEEAPRQVISLKPTGTQQAEVQRYAEEREQRRLLEGLRQKPDLPQSMRDYLQLMGPRAEITPERLKTTGEIEEEMRREEQSRIRVAQASRPPREGPQPSQYLVRGKDMTIATPEETKRLLQEGWRPVGARGGRGAEGEAARESAQTVLGEIDKMSRQINTGAGGLMGPVTTATGMLRRKGAQWNIDNLVNEYESTINGFVPMIARAVGHVGVLTQQDVDSVKGLFPQVTDNQQLAKDKMERVYRILSNVPPGLEEQADLAAPYQSPLMSSIVRAETMKGGTQGEGGGLSVRPQGVPGELPATRPGEQQPVGGSLYETYMKSRRR